VIAGRAVAAVATLVACGFTALACAAAPGKPPDLSGFWNLSRNGGEPDPALMAKVPAGTVLLRDTGAVEFGPMNFGGLKPTPEALRNAQAWDIKQDMTVAASCRIPSIVYAMQGPFPIEIFQGTELLVIRLEYFDMTRVVFLDGRPGLPADGPHTKTGDSHGRWEGDTLVVTTTHLKESTITNNGLEHGRRMKVTERFRLSADGRRLLATQEYDDPEMLENRGVRYIVWDKDESDHVHAYDCDPSFAENYAQ
jgi:hypothetical protein